MFEHEIMIIRQTAKESIERIEERQGTTFSIDMQMEFISRSMDLGNFDHYKVFPDDVKNMPAKIQINGGTSDRKIFLRVVLLRAIILTSNGSFLKKLPARVLKFELNHLKRIAMDMRTEEEWLDISHDTFHKEFGLATLRLLAAGAQLIDVRCGIPRSMLFKEGMSKLPRRLSIFYKLGGFRPFFQIHTHIYNLDNFNEIGWNECYRCCAELYHLFPASRGMFGSSWFYDPVLKNISPRLNYLREIPLKGGAKLLFDSTGGGTIIDSTATSASRRNLFESGKYSPKSYMLIWGCHDQITWAAEKYKTI